MPRVALGERVGDGGRRRAVGRLPCQSRAPSRVTGIASGWASVNQGGGEAVGVASTTRIPLRQSRSSVSSSQPNSYRPSSGSRIDQENTPTVAIFTRASRISASSCAHTLSSHCSGL